MKKEEVKYITINVSDLDSLLMENLQENSFSYIIDLLENQLDIEDEQMNKIKTKFIEILKEELPSSQKFTLASWIAISPLCKLVKEQ